MDDLIVSLIKAMYEDGTIEGEDEMVDKVRHFQCKSGTWIRALVSPRSQRKKMCRMLSLEYSWEVFLWSK